MRTASALLSLLVWAGGVTSAQSFVTGTALYRERIVLAADAVVEVTLEDVSRADAKAEVLGRVTLHEPGQPPFAPATPFEGTTWNLTHLGDDRVTTSSPDRDITLHFDKTNNRVTGSAGCNRLTGGYVLKGYALSFTPLAITRKTCPDAALEARFLAALGKVATYQIAVTRLELLAPDGALLARFDARPDRGGVLIVKSDNALLTTWDGVFFELDRVNR